MRINLKQFKKVREDNNSATLKNERGHEITLAKKALRPHLLKAVSDLPIHLAEGSQEPVKDPQEDSAPALPTKDEYQDQVRQKLNERMGQLANLIHGAHNVLFGDNSSADPNEGKLYQANPAPAPDQAPPPTDQPAPAPSPRAAPPSAPPQGQSLQPSSMPDPYAQYQGGINQQIHGIQGEAQAQDEMRQHLAPAMQANADSMVNANMRYENERQRLDDERERVQQDIRDGYIKPNHYIESMDSGQKTRTAIGLMLSGAGAGLSHQQNLAANFLQSQIDRDISAQQKNLGANENLLSANTHMYGNARDGLAATRIQLQDTLAAQIQAEAAKSPYPMAKLKADQLIGQLRASSAAQAHQFALQRMAMQQLNGQQQGGQSDPATKIRLMEMTGMMPKEDAKAASDALGKINGIEKLRQSVEENAGDLNNKFLAGKLEPGYRDAKINNLAGILGKVAEGRFNLEESKAQMGAMMPGAFNRNETRGAQMAGRQQFFDALRAEHDEALKKYGISIPRSQPLQKGPPVK